ncbi:MAG: HlyD family secretion protein [Oscillochloridaceae bacterium umkhey_bin13]
MRKKLIATALLAVALGGCAAPAQQTPAVNPAPTMVLPVSEPAAAPAPADAAAITLPTAAPAAVPGLDLGVSASGQITARRTADLAFRVPGTVTEILVDEGDTVRAGQPLVQLDLAELNLAVRQAEAGLAQAESGYQRLIDGASTEEVAAARAQLSQAQGALRQARGSVTDADIAAAEAALASAVARQAEVAAGPKDTDRQQAEAGVAQARANLEIQRTNLSAAKNNAQLQLDQALNGLRDAQQAYSTIYWDNKNRAAQLAKFGLELPAEAVRAEEQLLRQVENAESRVGQARLGVEQATQNEVDGIRAAEAGVRNAEAQLQRLIQGATAEQRAAVDAQVAQARATLDRLRGDQRAGSLQTAQAGVAAAQANFERITSDPSNAALAGAMAQVEQAKAALEAAQLNLAKGTLTAPFEGVVARINVDVGDLAGGSPLPAVQIVDLSELRVEVNVSDTDVARLREGMSARVNVDALPGQVFPGTVTFIAPTATAVGNVRTYAVRVTLDDARPAGLRPGMNARVAIQVE